jgi:hypothetical protein
VACGAIEMKVAVLAEGPDTRLFGEPQARSRMRGLIGGRRSWGQRSKRNEHYGFAGLTIALGYQAGSMRQLVDISIDTVSGGQIEGDLATTTATYSAARFITLVGDRVVEFQENIAQRAEGISGARSSWSTLARSPLPAMASPPHLSALPCCLSTARGCRVAAELFPRPRRIRHHGTIR